MPEEIPQSQARGYQQVAALVCEDIELLAEIASDTTLAADQLRRQITLMQKRKDAAINDPAGRERRYAACCMLYGLPPDSIRSDPIGLTP